MSLRDENEKRRKHKIDDCRRVHDYDEFITTFVSMLAEQSLLGDLLEHGLNMKRSNRFGFKCPIVVNFNPFSFRDQSKTDGS